MTTIYRFSKDTIRNQILESSVTYSDSKIILSESHIRTDSFKTIKEFEKELTDEEAQQYISINKDYLIEKYNK